MSFPDYLREVIENRDELTCQSPECFGYRNPAEGHPRQRPLTGMGYLGRVMVNGGYYGQVMHVDNRDYPGRDNRLYNNDLSLRAYWACTLCHLEHEVIVQGNLKMGLILAAHSTVRTIEQIVANAQEAGAFIDDDIPEGIFESQAMTREVNNERRRRFFPLLLRQLGGRLVIPEGVKLPEIDESPGFYPAEVYDRPHSFKSNRNGYHRRR